MSGRGAGWRCRLERPEDRDAAVPSKQERPGARRLQGDVRVGKPASGLLLGAGAQARSSRMTETRRDLLLAMATVLDARQLRRLQNDLGWHDGSGLGGVGIAASMRGALDAGAQPATGPSR